MSSRTNRQVAAAATTTADLHPGGLLLLGLFHRPEGAVALVRDGAGRILTVAPGVRLDDWEVTAIGDTALHLVRDGEERVLSMPG